MTSSVLYDFPIIQGNDSAKKKKKKLTCPIIYSHYILLVLSFGDNSRKGGSGAYVNDQELNKMDVKFGQIIHWSSLTTTTPSNDLSNTK